LKTANGVTKGENALRLFGKSGNPAKMGTAEARGLTSGFTRAKFTGTVKDALNPKNILNDGPGRSLAEDDRQGVQCAGEGNEDRGRAVPGRTQGESRRRFQSGARPQGRERWDKANLGWQVIGKSDAIVGMNNKLSDLTGGVVKTVPIPTKGGVAGAVYDLAVK